MNLDEARDEAVGLLILFAKMIVTAQARQIANYGRQYVTAQAKYTNMLKDWENENTE